MRPLVGLVGKSIGRSLAPSLHEAAGKSCGLDVRYQLFDAHGLGFGEDALGDILFAAQRLGFTGLNITFPFKEGILDHLDIRSPDVKRVGSCNTVLFRNRKVEGYNTDYTGFISAWRGAFGNARPGIVFVIGGGGVGKAIVHGLSRLNATEIRLFDVDRERAAALADAVSIGGATRCVAVGDIEDGIDGADGIINATPVGMYAYPGNPLGGCAPRNIRYAMDAIYTPLMTEFLLAAKQQGAQILTGRELCVYQAANSFEIWFGRPAPLQIMMKTFEAGIKSRDEQLQKAS
ncbi:MAG TPA: shikimate dehydrogenase [Pseudorhodoplanes sp.]|nr:shikimate dehydrogenase [Pseudorhodoplanes sp.]